MSVATIAQTIRQRFEAQWTAQSPTVAHFYSGQPVSVFQISRRPWVRCTAMPHAAGQGLVGGRRKRVTGTAIVDVWTPVAEGDGLAIELCDQVAGVWELTSVAGVVFGASSIQRLPGSGPWLQYVVSTPWRADFSTA